MKTSRLIAAVQYAAACGVCFLLGGCTAESDAPRGIESDVSRTILVHEGSLSGAEPRAFAFRAQEGDKLRIALRQFGNDLQLEVLDGANNVLAVSESQTGRYGEDLLLLTVTESAEHSIRIKSARNPRVAGRFWLSIERAAMTAPGEQAFSDASRSDPIVSPPERIHLLDMAAREFGRHGRFREQGLAAMAANNVLNDTASDAPSAIERGEAAVYALRCQSDSLLLASALSALAIARGENGEASAMKAYFDEARLLFENGDSAIGIAEADLYEAALNYSGVHDPKLLATLEGVVTRCEHLQETPCLALALQDVGILVRNNEDLDTALNDLHRALSLVDPVVNSREYSDIADNLAFTLRMSGDFDGAVQYHRAALASSRIYGECSVVSRSYYGLGYSLLGIGDNEQSPGFYSMGLGRICALKGWGSSTLQAKASPSPSVRSLCEQIGATSFVHPEDRQISSWTAWDLGNFARGQADPETAYTCHSAASNLLEWPSDILGTQLESVRDLIDLKRTKEAKSLYATARPALKSAGRRNRALGIEVQALLQSAQGNNSKALRTFARAAEAYDHAKFYEGEFSALSTRAELSVRTRSSNADEYFESADASLERVRLLSLDPAFSASLFASGRRIYETWVDSMRSRGQSGSVDDLNWQTLAISERSRGRLLAQIAKAFRVGSASRSARLRFVAGGAADELHNPPAAGIRNTNLEDANESSKQGEASKTRPPPFDAQAIKDSVARLRQFQAGLDDSTTAIEFLIGESRSGAWIVRRETISFVELPPGAVIREGVALAQEGLVGDTDPDQAKRVLGRLHDLVFAPLAPQIAGDRLIIVPDDALNEIPFAALWDSRNDRFVVQSFEISYLPSMQLARDRTSTIQRTTFERALVVGDAVYDPLDAAERCTKTDSSVLAVTNYKSLPRLPASGLEIKNISDALRLGGVSVEELKGCSANRNAVLKGLKQSHEVVHFATHATADLVVPQRSAIHLSAVGLAGDAIEGELTAADLLDERIEADLVVLSGCSTAGGRQFSGEGAMGLSYSLIAAGGRQIVSTLWPVLDVASAEAMKIFYESLMSAGMPAASALHAMQLKMLNSKPWAHPRHWAAYTIMGS